MLYEIKAEYRVTKILEVDVPEGRDPSEPANWATIESEHDSDCYIYDVLTTEARG